MTLTIALVLAVAGLANASSESQLEQVLYKAQIFPAGVVPWIAVTVPPLEIVLSLALCVPKLRSSSLWGALALFGLFSAYNLWRIIHGIGVPCACFGAIFKATAPISLAVSLTMLVLSYAALSKQVTP